MNTAAPIESDGVRAGQYPALGAWECGRAIPRGQVLRHCGQHAARPDGDESLLMKTCD